MVQSRGNTGRAVTATAGIEIPLAPRVLTDAEVEARMYRQTAAGADPGSTLSRLRAEMAGAHSTISELQARVQQQDAAITEAAANVQASVSRAQARIEALIAELAATAPPSDSRAVPTRATVPAGVQCAGGCGLEVSGEYVARTGRTWHGPCQDHVPAHLLQAPVTAQTAAPTVRRAAA